MKKSLVTLFLLIMLVVCFAFSKQKKISIQYSFSGEPKTKAQLGEVLFFEKILSSDSTKSCASCHIPEYGFADTVAFSKGVMSRTGGRNAPSCANIADRPYLFYDGRAATLEDQVKFPIENEVEMNLPLPMAVKRLQQNKEYIAWFQSVFKEEPNENNLKIAIASYERTLETSKTTYDRYMANDDSTLMGESALRGRTLFLEKARCFECHFTPDFTGDEFRNIGLFDGGKLNDTGRYLISKDKADIGKFKVPGLRNVAVTAPYMHNGMFKTLKEVIEYYNEPLKVVPHPINTDSILTAPLNLSTQDKIDLEAFLNTLTDDRFKKRQ